MDNLALPVVVELLAFFKAAIANGTAMWGERPTGWEQLAVLPWVWMYGRCHFFTFGAGNVPTGCSLRSG